MRTSATVLGLLLIAALAVCITSCAKAPSDSEEPAAVTLNVRVYYPPYTPRCPYEPVAWLSNIPVGKLAHAGRGVGADAVIDVRPVYESDIRGRSRKVAEEGLAIRFTDRKCMY